MDAGLGVPVVGVHDAPANPVVFLRRVASLQKATKAFRAVAPLPKRVAAEAPSTGYDDTRLIALATLLVDGVDRVQVDWRQHGAKLSQVALLFGANDVDHVPATDEAPLGPRRAPLEEVRRNIAAASLTPVARTARFDTVPDAGPDRAGGAS
jgi:aminodeoxyfutalosine synthase